MIKSINATLSIFIAFVLVSSAFSFNGSVYAQNTITPDESFDSSTTSAPEFTENQTEFTEDLTGFEQGFEQDTNVTQSVGENATHGDIENTTSGHIVRDSVTLLLEDRSLPEGDFIHLYDSTPFKIQSGHIAAKLPCNSDNATDVNVLVGIAPELSPTDLDFVPELSSAGDLCLYHADLPSDSASTITDIAILNNSTDDIEFPETSTVAIGVNEIAELSSEEHGNTS
jgi:hypothetical protein